MSKDKTGTFIFLIALALVLGIALTKLAWPTVIEQTKLVNSTDFCDTYKICDPCIQEPCGYVECEECEACDCKETVCTKNTPNEELIENNELIEEQEKHARVQTVFITCDEWNAREIGNGNLVGNCWKEKRTIIDLESRRNGNLCAVLSTSGC